MTVQLLIQNVNDIICLSGKETDLHEKNILSADGKESRGSKRKSGNKGEARALQTLNVYSSDYGMCIAQKFIEEKVRSFFDEEKREGIRKSGKGYKKTLEKEHGGTALREYYITEDVGWYADRKEWDKLKSFGMVHKTLRKGEKTEEEYRYYICSIGEDAEEFERAARGHWGVENGLHWHLDFTFRDDKNTSMAKTGAKTCRS